MHKVLEGELDCLGYALCVDHLKIEPRLVGPLVLGLITIWGSPEYELTQTDETDDNKI